MKTLLSCGVIIILFVAISNLFKDNSTAENYSSPIESEGPQLEDYFFKKWHYPYGTVLPPEMYKQMLEQVNSMPDENEVGDVSINSWRYIGPYGMDVTYTNARKHSGRVLDIEAENGANTRVASASGGLWELGSGLPSALSDDVNDLAISSFATKPGDPNTIIIGTGEFDKRNGIDLFKTTNRGVNWTQLLLPNSFLTRTFRLRYNPLNANQVHAVTDGGYFRSDDGGSTWNKFNSGVMCDIAINPVNPNIIYAGYWEDGNGNGGLYKSVNNGTAWLKVTTSGIPTSNVGRTSVSICKSNPSVIYVAMARNDNNAMLGVYRSVNDGSSWNNISPSSDIFTLGGGSQGNYDNVIAVSPTNSQLVLAGGIELWRSSDGGSSWSNYSDDDIHNDFHSLTWLSNGTGVWAGNDGGIAFSNDGGQNWSTSSNTLPITQYFSVSAGVSNTNIITGGSHDNGISVTNNGGSSWQHTKKGDGGGVRVDPFNNSIRILATNGVNSNGITFPVYKSVDFGQNWTMMVTGLDNCSQWFTRMRSDGINPVYFITNCGGTVYRADFATTQWTKVNTTPFSSDINNLTLESGYTMYCCLNSNQSGNRLKVIEGTTINERSAGLPDSAFVRTVENNSAPSSFLSAYALMEGLNTSSQKIYSTGDRGVTWINRTGNMPNIPMGDIIVRRANVNTVVLYLGTEFGCFKSTNSGTSWFRWNNGMPAANIITEMTYIDSTLANGKVYIVAATYGRGIWLREISGSDPAFSINGARTNINKPIGDFQTIYDTINISVPAGGIITDITLKIDTVLHGNDGDIEMSLIHQGITDTAIYRVGGSGDNFIGTVLNDSSVIPIASGSSPFSSNFAPSKPLGQFSTVNPNGTWILRIYDRTAGNTGMLKAWSLYMSYQNPIGIIPVSGNIPSKFTLGQNYPNPFNPTATIKYGLPKDVKVVIKIYDMLGREVKTLVNEFKQAGYYQAIFDGTNLASGVYLYRIEAGSFVDSRKMVLIK